MSEHCSEGGGVGAPFCISSPRYRCCPPTLQREGRKMIKGAGDNGGRDSWRRPRAAPPPSCSAQSRKTERRHTKGPPPIIIYLLPTLKHLTSSSSCSSSLPSFCSPASHKQRRDKARLAFPGKLLPAAPFLPKLDENEEFRPRPPKSPPPPSLNGLWSLPPLSLQRWQYKAISGWPTFQTIYVGQGQDRLKCSEIASRRRRVEERGRQSIPAATQIYPPTPTLDCLSFCRRLFLLPAVGLEILSYRLVGNCWPLFSPGPIERLLSINLGRLAGMLMAVLKGNGSGEVAECRQVLEVRRVEKGGDLEAGSGGRRCSQPRHTVAFPLRRRVMGGDQRFIVIVCV